MRNVLVILNPDGSQTLVGCGIVAQNVVSNATQVASIPVVPVVMLPNNIVEVINAVNKGNLDLVNAVFAGIAGKTIPVSEPVVAVEPKPEAIVVPSTAGAAPVATGPAVSTSATATTAAAPTIPDDTINQRVTEMQVIAKEIGYNLSTDQAKAFSINPKYTADWARKKLVALKDAEIKSKATAAAGAAPAAAAAGAAKVEPTEAERRTEIIRKVAAEAGFALDQTTIDRQCAWSTFSEGDSRFDIKRRMAQAEINSRLSQDGSSTTQSWELSALAARTKNPMSVDQIVAAVKSGKNLEQIKDLANATDGVVSAQVGPGNSEDYQKARKEILEIAQAVKYTPDVAGETMFHQAVHLWADQLAKAEGVTIQEVKDNAKTAFEGAIKAKSVMEAS